MVKSQPNRRTSRRKLEKQIVLAAANIHQSNRDTPNETCFDQPAVDQFVGAWFSLVHYYRDNDDRDIGVEVVREYIYWLNRFGAIHLNPNRDKRCIDQARDALIEMEGLMTEIIRIIEHRIYPQGR
jgi:hypothetical protein